MKHLFSLKKYSVPVILVLSLGVLAGCASTGPASARGYELRVRYAEVEGIERVQLPSAAPAGAMVGGFTGLVISSGKSTRSQVASGVGGAVLGGMAVRSLEGDRRGYQYTLRYGDDSISRFITEKGYFIIGDCVSVERGNYANIRRVASVLCDSGPSKVIDESHVREAEQCHAAKDQLLAATTQEAIDSSSRKVAVLCQ